MCLSECFLYCDYTVTVFDTHTLLFCSTVSERREIVRPERTTRTNGFYCQVMVAMLFLWGLRRRQWTWKELKREIVWHLYPRGMRRKDVDERSTWPKHSLFSACGWPRARSLSCCMAGTAAQIKVPDQGKGLNLIFRTKFGLCEQSLFPLTKPCARRTQNAWVLGFNGFPYTSIHFLEIKIDSLEINI